MSTDRPVSDETDETSDYETVLQTVAVRLEAGDAAGALSTLAAFLTRHPQDGRAWGDLGVIAFQTGRKADACHAFGRAVQSEPDNEEARQRLAAILMRLDRRAEAEGVLAGRSISDADLDAWTRAPREADGAADKQSPPSPRVDATPAPSPMTVTRFAYDTACVGPIKFRITWVCASCATENTFTRLGTLLPPERRPCLQCGTPALYRFDAARHAPDPETLARLAPLEERLFDTAGSHTDQGLTLLGLNLSYPIMSYPANLSRSQSGEP